MGKKLVIAVFILCFAVAVYAYVTRDKRSLHDNLAVTAAKEPRVIMEDFTVYRYQGESLTGRLTARLGRIYEPNIVELESEIRGERLNDNGYEYIGAESATAYFTAVTLTNMLGDANELERAELSGFVDVGVSEHTLSTDYAEYINGERRVRSARPVRVEGRGRVFSGEEGFTYSFDSGALEMPGPVNGMVRLDEEN